MDSNTKRTVLAGLTEMRELLGDPTRWTQNTNARTADGYQVVWHDARACKWCLNGALLKVFVRTYDSETPNKPLVALDEGEALIGRCASTLYGRSMVSANDELNHEAVVKIIDCAVKRAEGLVNGSADGPAA